MTVDAAVLTMLGVQSAALLFWAGQVHRAIKDHDRRLAVLESAREE